MIIGTNVRKLLAYRLVGSTYLGGQGYSSINATFAGPAFEIKGGTINYNTSDPTLFWGLNTVGTMT